MQFAYTCVVNGKEDADYMWVTLKEIYGDENEEQSQVVGFLNEMLWTHMQKATNSHGRPVLQGEQLLPKPCKNASKK